jgi:glycosyltransferase involved in cell wall biosynthesis
MTEAPSATVAEAAGRTVDLVVPGDPATRTGGYIYDRRIFEALDALGWRTFVHRLDDSFPRPTSAAIADAAEALAHLPAGRIVVLDGLALPGLAEVLDREAERLRLVALIHHPVALETGLTSAAREAIAAAEQASLARVRGTIATSAWTARTLAAQGVPSARIRVIEPGTDPPGSPDTAPRAGHAAALRRARPAHPPDGGAERSLPPGRDDRPPYRLLCVGTLTPRKGHALLIEALAPLRDRAWLLDCVGSTERDAATTAAVRSLIAEHGFERRVRLRGELGPDDMTGCYLDADAFVLASELEGYGMALAEAVAHGLPIVSTTAGAIPDTVPAAGSLLVPPGNREALSAALARLLDQPGLRRRLSAGALEARKNLPTWPTAGARFAAALEELAA